MLGDALTVVAVLDGLRPAVVGPATMPLMSALTAEATVYERAHAAFPAVTRANAATIATGCLPDRTGVWGNRVRHPALGAVDTGDADAVRRLRAQGAMPQRSFAEQLSRDGRNVLVVGNGSAGCTLLLNPGTDAGNGATISSVGATGSPFSAVPVPILDAVAPLGPPPADDHASLEWASRAAAAAVGTGWPDVLVFWSGQPDTEHHRSGPASAAGVRTLGAVDSALRRIHDATLADGRETNLIVTSDHGFCATVEAVEPGADFGAPDEVQLAYNGGVVLGYFADHVPNERRRHLAELLAEQTWAGPVFCADAACPPGAFDLSVVARPDLTPAADLLPDLIVTTRTVAGSAGETAQAWHVRASGTAAHRGVHGTLHADDLRIPLVLHGPAFARGGRPHTVAGPADIAPTVHALVTGSVPDGLDGRVLTEAFAGETHSVPGDRVTEIERGTHRIVVAEAGGSRHVVGATAMDVRI